MLSRLRARMAGGVAAVTVALALTAPAAAAEVQIPIHLDHEFIRQILVHEVFTEPGETAKAWKDASGCSFMTLSSPRVESVGVRIRLVSPGEGRVGKKIGNYCMTAVDWKGTVEILEEVRVEPDVPIVHFRVADAILHGSNADKQATETLSGWLKQYVEPKLELVTVDLRPAMTELKSLIPLTLAREDSTTVQAMVDSLRVLGAEADTTGLVTRLGLEAPDRPHPPSTEGGTSKDGDAGDGAPPPRPAEPALTPEELARWDSAWQRWDAFLTFIAKHVAADAASRELRDAMLGVLLDSRQDVLELLAPSQDGVDPLRSLFSHTWERLAPVLREVAAAVPGTEALRYATFLSAGDALTALNAVGPQLGVDVTADGLRHMARMLTPQLSDDPLAYGEQVDPELRRIFGFGRPLFLPEERLATTPRTGEAAPSGHASAEEDPELIARLNGWLPSRENRDEYLPLMRSLLVQTAEHTMADAGEGLSPQQRDAFRSLVLATAWQESCWRQWIAGKEGERKVIRSRAGAVGLMQVLERAWRGFYDLRALRNDVDYNARAGVEILLRYLTEHAIDDPKVKSPSDTDMLARATYAIYHAGPRKGANRLDNPRTPKRIRRIDGQFWQRYQDVKAGNELRVGDCWGG